MSDEIKRSGETQQSDNVSLTITHADEDADVTKSKPTSAEITSENTTENMTKENEAKNNAPTGVAGTSAAATAQLAALPTAENAERCCWICFATEEDNRLAAWVQPCKCRGTTKWVHQSCLYRWIDEKQKGNALRAVNCQQCQTDYIIVFPAMNKFANILEAIDQLLKRVCPFIAAGIFVGSIYWSAVTYGAVTFLQVVGYKKGLAIMENGDPLILLIGLPAIPVGLVLGRLIRWEEAVLRMLRSRQYVARKLPLMNFIIPYADEQHEGTTAAQQHPPTPTLADPVSITRVLCGALLLPTISSIIGRLLFDSVDNTLHRTLLGGLTFVTVKGILKIYLRQQQFTRRKKRRIVDYNEENVRVFANRNAARNAAAAAAAHAELLGQIQRDANRGDNIV